MSQQSVIDEILNERRRQDAKWGEQNHPLDTGGECYVRLAEMRKAICESDKQAGKERWRNILLEEVYEAFAEPPGPKLREELIQVAAVVVAMIESYDRNEGKNGKV